MALKGLGDLLLHDEDGVKGPFVAVGVVGVVWVALSIFFNFNLDLLARLIAAQNRNSLSSCGPCQNGGCDSVKFGSASCPVFRISIVDCPGKDESDPPTPFWRSYCIGGFC